LDKKTPKFRAFIALLTKLSTEDPQSCRNFLRMDKEAFEELLELVYLMLVFAEIHCYL
jgi:hypothetical protein